MVIWMPSLKIYDVSIAETKRKTEIVSLIPNFRLKFIMTHIHLRFLGHRHLVASVRWGHLGSNKGFNPDGG